VNPGQTYGVAVALLLGGVQAFGQDAESPPEPILEIAVETQLVRIDVVVTDDSGRPTAGLTREDFVVFEDGEPQRITQFEVFEEGRPVRPPGGEPEPEDAGAESYRRRYVVLAVDDLHIDPGNLLQAKLAMRRFVERDLGPEDQVAVVATSGATGLYQEFTSDAEVLRQAIGRVTPQMRHTAWTGVPHISEYQAELIDRGDVFALELAVDEILSREPPGADRGDAERRARIRARAVMAEASNFSRQTMLTVEGVMRGLTELPGRKVLVLVSDGFLLGLGTSNHRGFDLRDITDAGTRSGVVVYSLDTRGLIATPPIGDASTVAAPSIELPGLRERLTRDAEGARRDGMNGLAEGTGGFLVHSTNDLGRGLDRILSDTETYYLLAYEPTNTKRDGRFRRIEVKIPDRSGFKARTRQGYFAPDEKDDRRAANDDPEVSGRRAAGELQSALSSLYPRTEIPVRLTTDFVDLGSAGPQLVINGNVDLRPVRFRQVGDAYVATLVLAGAIFDAAGLPAAELEPQLADLRLSREDHARALHEGLKYYKLVSLEPGAYQVRLAVREDGPGRLGSASERIEIPDTEDGRLTMGGPFLLRGSASGEGAESGTPPPLQEVQAFPRFKRGDSLYYQLQVLNPKLTDSGETNLTIQVHVTADGRERASTPEQPLTLRSVGAIPKAYTGRIPLAPFDPGQYELEVVVTDRLVSTSVHRYIAFNVEP
jgi:VWFA-related protein